MQRFLWPTNKIREKFIEYFCRDNGHKFIKSSSVLPRKGSGTYFTNAGMNQFKPIILGEQDARELIDFDAYIGAANSQKCIRIGGKHNDLDDIGKDTYHHTFFEMLGNWSFGAYENEKACEMALELLVNVYGLNVDALYFTYFAGDLTLGLEPDSRTKNIWLRLGIPAARVLPFGMSANFWEMDEVGPCGPCTEIHYDRDLHKPGGRELVNAGTERVIELWNLVFMNYNRTARTSFTRLPSPVVDTGMGLERLAAVLNNLSSNYDSDLFTPIFEHIHRTSEGIREYRNCPDGPLTYSYRTLSDHLRSIVVSVSDGLMPSRNGLGGFLKYLILKCLQLSRDTFKVSNEAEFLCGLVPIVVDSLKISYPELSNKTAYIQQVIRATHERQREKLKASAEISERYFKKLNEPTELSGEQIWRLFKGDASGEEIPIEFIGNFFARKKVHLDMAGFERILLADNEKSLRNMNNTRVDHTPYIDLANKLTHLPKTDDSHKYSFDMTNICSTSVRASVQAIGVKNAQTGLFDLVDEVKPNQPCAIILDRTNFYPESGGQLCDRGSLTIPGRGLTFQVENVVTFKGYSFHLGKLIHGDSIKLRDELDCQIDNQYRHKIALNHTGVHLINHAIRKHYHSESSIIQTSSCVRSDHLKFEFKFVDRLCKPTVDDLTQIQSICNDLIQKAMPVYTTEGVNVDKSTPRYPLRKLDDVLYPSRVRVVSIGAPWDQFERGEQLNENTSAELCCGTHATNTRQLDDLVITTFSIVGDSSIEIDACTSESARQTRLNDKRVLDLFAEMIDLHARKNELSQSSSEQLHTVVNAIADRSIKIENLFKQKQNSYLVLQWVKNESVKYRPSKNMIQNVFKRYVEDELSRPPAETDQTHRAFASLAEGIRYLEVQSVLNYDQIVNILNKLNAPGRYSTFIVYNNYRNVFVLYSKKPLDENEITIQFENCMRNASLVENKKYYRVYRQKT